jgi:hypothetical protein
MCRAGRSLEKKVNLLLKENGATLLAFYFDRKAFGNAGVAFRTADGRVHIVEVDRDEVFENERVYLGAREALPNGSSSQADKLLFGIGESMKT